jgi:hypothetical protein
MSLIRLLRTTRSLSDVKNEPSPYRMTEQGLLPKFGPRNQAGRARRSAEPPDSAGAAKANLGEGHGDRKDAGCSLKSESSRKPKGLAAWWQKLFRRQPRREPVQTEFSLDLVKVVRNDLADAEETRNKEKPRRAEPKPEEESVFGVSRG